MPLPKDMDACMRKVKKEFPAGRSSKKKTKGDAHKQHVAMCLQAQESYSMKELIGDMTFTSFLIVEAMPEMDTSTIRGYIRSLPMYQELIKDPQSKPEALKLAKRLVDEFGSDPMDNNVQSYILDQFDDLASQALRGGFNIGDWKGEEEYKRREQEDKDIESAVSKWEQTTGMDAETGAELPKKRMGRGATHQAGKFAKAKAEMSAFADAPAPEQADRLTTARTQAAAAGAPARGDKMRKARAIFGEDFGTKKPSEIIRRMMDEAGMSKPHATTYYYKFKKAAG